LDAGVYIYEGGEAQFIASNIKTLTTISSLMKHDLRRIRRNIYDIFIKSLIGCCKEETLQKIL